MSARIDRHVNVVSTPDGFSEGFDDRAIATLVSLGLIKHDEDRYVLEDGQGNPLGDIHRFYERALSLQGPDHPDHPHARGAGT